MTSSGKISSLPGYPTIHEFGRNDTNKSMMMCITLPPKEIMADMKIAPNTEENV